MHPKHFLFSIEQYVNRLKIYIFYISILLKHFYLNIKIFSSHLQSIYYEFLHNFLIGNSISQEYPLKLSIYLLVIWRAFFNLMVQRYLILNFLLKLNLILIILSLKLHDLHVHSNSPFLKNFPLLKNRQSITILSLKISFYFFFIFSFLICLIYHLITTVQEYQDHLNLISFILTSFFVFLVFSIFFYLFLIFSFQIRYHLNHFFFVDSKINLILIINH